MRKNEERRSVRRLLFFVRIKKRATEREIERVIRSGERRAAFVGRGECVGVSAMNKLFFVTVVVVVGDKSVV